MNEYKPVKTYLWRRYVGHDTFYAYKSGESSTNFEGFSLGVSGVAKGLVKVASDLNRPLNFEWEIPPDEKDLLSPNGVVLNFVVSPKEKHRIAAALFKEVEKALSGK